MATRKRNSSPADPAAGLSRMRGRCVVTRARGSVRMRARMSGYLSILACPGRELGECLLEVKNTIRVLLGYRLISFKFMYQTWILAALYRIPKDSKPIHVQGQRVAVGRGNGHPTHATPGGFGHPEGVRHPIVRPPYFVPQCGGDSFCP